MRIHNVNFADHTPGVVTNDKDNKESGDTQVHKDFSGLNNEVHLPFAQEQTHG